MLAFAASFLGCRCDRQDRAGVEELTIEAKSVTHWADSGFVEMVPPLRPPTSPDGSLLITVWLKLPANSKIVTLAMGDGYTLKYPAGTEAERVEQFLPYDRPDREVADVRGTRFLEDGEEFRVLRRKGEILKGFRWLRGDPAVQERATAALGELLKGHKHVERLKKLNRCAFCHVYSRERRTTSLGGMIPNRPSDASGLYQVQSVLYDEVAVEYTRPRSTNLDDPHITFRCTDPSNKPVVAREANGKQDVRCPENGVVIGKLDVAAARAAGDERVEKMCQSRKFLYEYMDDKGREVFAPAIAACD